MDETTRAEPREGFRPDIEGLRGIAVLLVVLFHGGLLAMPGGFIGVDVFFVISGFLITGLLIRERERTGRIRLRAFYARRVRRLLPAGMIALAATLFASFAILAPLDRSSAALDAAATALSIGNIRFALAAGDYFANVAQPTPFLHFWSLAVEEQFYLLWPALVLLAARGALPRRGAGVALGLVLIASFLASLVVTNLAASWAFYSLPTRAWQLALGGLLAIAGAPLARVRRSIAAVLGWIGLATLVVASFVLDGSLPYPGALALIPTLAAAALVTAGMTGRGPGRVLATPPLRLLGRISYSLYLWHWPLFILPAVALEAEPSYPIRLALAGAAIVAAWLSWRFIEEPFRTGFPTLSRYPGRTVLVGAMAIILAVISSGGLALAAEHANATAMSGDSVLAAEQRIPPASLDPLSLWTPGPSGGGLAGSSTGPAPSTFPPVPSSGVASPDPTGSPTATPAPVTYVRLPDALRRSLAVARRDEERLRADGCLAFEAATVPRTCVYGDPNGTFTVALVGDSHAAQWFPALERIAVARHWRVVTFVKVACPFLDMRVRNLALKREYTECETYREATIARLGALRADLTLISSSRFAIHPVFSEDAATTRQGAALARFVDRLPGEIGLIVDTPDPGRDVPSCLSDHVRDVRTCAATRAVAYSGHLGAIEAAAAESSGAGLIDLTARVCRADPCPVAVDGMIVFRDARHLTATFARSLAPDLDRAIGMLLEGLRPTSPGGAY
jgi:peptidoglycan/LPS O-acetylase OafA/YrhL